MIVRHLAAASAIVQSRRAAAGPAQWIVYDPTNQPECADGASAASNR